MNSEDERKLFRAIESTFSELGISYRKMDFQATSSGASFAFDYMVEIGRDRIYVEVKSRDRVGISDILPALSAAAGIRTEGRTASTFVVTNGQVTADLMSKADELGLRVVTPNEFRAEIQRRFAPKSTEGEPSMPTMSFYVPPEALQGQDVPSHLLWKDLDWNKIELRFPETLDFKACYNAKEQFFEVAPGRITVLALEREGYLGVVFKSKRAESLSIRPEVEANIELKMGNSIHEIRTIHLFRPSLALRDTPPAINIHKNGSPSARIRLQRLGFGTIIVSAVTADDSDIQLTLPEQLAKAFDGFAKDLFEQMRKLREKYPKYEALFATAEKVDYRKRDEAVALLAEASADLAPDREFLDDFANAFATAVIRNTDFELLVVQPMLEFVKSAVGKKVLFSTPFYEFECDENPRKLALKFECLDLLAAKLVTLTTPPIELSAEKKQRVQLGSLVEWISHTEES